MLSQAVLPEVSSSIAAVMPEIARPASAAGSSPIVGLETRSAKVLMAVVRHAPAFALP